MTLKQTLEKNKELNSQIENLKIQRKSPVEKEVVEYLKTKGFNRITGYANKKTPKGIIKYLKYNKTYYHPKGYIFEHNRGPRLYKLKNPSEKKLNRFLRAEGGGYCFRRDYVKGLPLGILTALGTYFISPKMGELQGIPQYILSVLGLGLGTGIGALLGETHVNFLNPKKKELGYGGKALEKLVEICKNRKPN